MAVEAEMAALGGEWLDMTNYDGVWTVRKRI